MPSNHKDVVEREKAKLVAAGADLSGPCGAFSITKAVAWALRGEGAGLLDKPSGNNCQGYSVDIVAYKDGSIFDILGDGGGANEPQWNASDAVDPARWRPAIDPGGDPEPDPGPTPSPCPSVDLEPVQAHLEAIDKHLYDQGERIYADLVARLERLEAKEPTFPTYKGSIFGININLTPQK